MNTAIKAMIFALAAGLAFSGASCKDMRRQVAEKVVKETTKKVVTPEGCDAAMGQNMSEQDQADFQKKMEPILEEIRVAKDPIAAFDGKKDAFRALFDEYVKKHGLDAKCTDMLNDKFMAATKEQLQSAM